MTPLLYRKMLDLQLWQETIVVGVFGSVLFDDHQSPVSKHYESLTTIIGKNTTNSHKELNTMGYSRSKLNHLWGKEKVFTFDIIDNLPLAVPTLP